jgi:ProP effector
MSDTPTLTLGTTKRKEEKVNISAKTQAKPTSANSKNKSHPVKHNKSNVTNPQAKKLTPQERKARSKAKYAATFKKLIKLYPKCFSATPSPLALGIHRSIWEEEAKKPEDERISKSAIRHFLLVYTSSKAYQQAIMAGGSRIDQLGNTMEKVSVEHIETAKKSLEDWDNKQATWQQNNKPKPQK